MNKNMYLIGVGNYTEVIIELAKDCGYEVSGLYHYNSDRLGEIVGGVKIIGTTQDIFKKDISNQNFGITIGENKKRTILADQIRQAGGKTPSLIHPKATVSSSAVVSDGCFIQNGASVWASAKINYDCILCPFSYVAHHSQMDKGCFITPFSIVGAYTILGKRVFMGLNSVIIPNITIGQDVIIGAKANVINNCEDNLTLVGNPAKSLNK